MQLDEVIRRRRMVRSYDPARPVARAVIDDLLALAVRAPSAGFTQGWHFLVLDDPASVGSFWEACSGEEPPDPWLSRMRTAPALIITFSDKSAYLNRYSEPDKGWTDRSEAHWPIPYWHVDTGMAALILLLGATDAGLASCFFGVPGERWEALRVALTVPETLTPVGVVSLGYPAPDLRSPSLRRGRRPMDSVVSYGSFSQDQ